MFNYYGGYMIVSGTPPEPIWLAHVAQELAAILELAPNWNSYGAPVVEKSAITQAFSVLQSIAKTDTPAPYVLPTPTGGVQFEWHTQEIDLEVEISPGREVSFLLDCTDKGKEYEGDLSSHLALVLEAVGKLSS